MRTLIVMGVLVLSGCATLSSDDCRRTSWDQLGKADALKGYPASRVYQHREACFKHGVQPDFEAYKAGHQAGLLEYCTFKGGYQAGRAGYSYKQLCPSETEAQFLEGYRTGRAVYQEIEHYELLYDNRFHRRYFWHPYPYWRNYH